MAEQNQDNLRCEADLYVKVFDSLRGQGMIMTELNQVTLMRGEDDRCVRVLDTLQVQGVIMTEVN